MDYMCTVLYSLYSIQYTYNVHLCIQCMYTEMYILQCTVYADYSHDFGVN